MSPMKKSKVIRKNKISENLEHRLTKVEEGLKEVKADVSEIMINVTNHIPSSITAVKLDLQTLLDRKREKEAVKDFLGHALKIVYLSAGVVWIALQVIEHFYTAKEGLARIFLGA